MRDAASQLTNGLHFLTLRKAFLQRALFSCVERENGCAAALIFAGGEIEAR